MTDYFKRAFKDVLFRRILIFLWSIPFLLIGVFAFDGFNLFTQHIFLSIIQILMILFGISILYASFLLENKKIKESDLLDPGADFVGIILIFLVIILAIPAWELIRRLRSN